MESLGLDGVLLIFASICVVGAFVEIFFIPETKGKNLYSSEESELRELDNLAYAERITNKL